MNELKAEFYGMHAGDGTLYCTKSKTIVWELRGGLDEIKYYDHAMTLIERLFEIKLKTKHRKGGGNGSFGIQTTNKTITSELTTYFPIGRKTSKLKIPTPIMQSPDKLKHAFLRGLFDTDGCIRFDKNHTKQNYYPKIELSSSSEKFRDEVKHLLDSIQIGNYTWNCTKRKEYKICIPGKKNLSKWNNSIGWRNPKHLNKLQQADLL